MAARTAAAFPAAAPSLPPGNLLSPEPLAVTDEIGSPMWWMRRLHNQLLMRRTRLAKLQRYFDGEFQLAYADTRLREAFGSVFYADRFGLNWMRLCVSAVEERLNVQGFRVGSDENQPIPVIPNPDPDKQPDLNVTANDPRTWDIWQEANLDELSSTVHLEALLNGSSYVTVWKGDDPDFPDITVSHPSQSIVETDPVNPKKRIAGLRIYADVYGFLHGDLFFADKVWLYRSTSPLALETADPENLRWIWDTDITPEGFMVNPYGVVPMVPFSNVPQLLSPGTENIARRSELWPVMPVQDTINSILFNMILTANTQGYRQRWVTGLEIERDENDKPVQPFKSGLERLFHAESVDTKFGEFSTTDITQFITALDMLTHTVAAISQVPPHYFSASADRLSGESIMAAETGLIAKVRRKMVAFGGAWEEVMRIAGVIAGYDELAQARNAEVLWRFPESRSEATLAAAAIARQQAGVPWQMVMEYLGYSPQEIQRMYVQRKADMAEAALLAPLSPVLRLTEAVGGPGQAPAPDIVPGQGEAQGAAVAVIPPAAVPTPAPAPTGNF